MSDQAARLRHAILRRTHVCSACHAELVVRVDAHGHDVLQCTYRCRPAGYVARADLAQATHERLTREDAAKVAAQVAAYKLEDMRHDAELDRDGLAALGWGDA